MIKLIRYLIYKNYKWQLFVNIKNPIRAGIFGVMFPLSFLLLSLTIFVDFIYGLNFGRLVIFPCLLFGFLFEYYLCHKVKEVGIKIIVSEFENTDKPREVLSTVLVLIYSFLAIFSPLIVLYIL